jgi:hypothetical protein
VAANARWLRIAVGVLGAVVLLWGNETSPSRLVWSVVIVVVLLAGIQVLIGAGKNRQPEVARKVGPPIAQT